MADALPRLTAALADRYRIERELGAGGMATVYHAHDLKHDRQVAIKVLRPELAAVLGSDRFVQEIKTTAHLQHPNILPLFDSGEADGFLYYVMPYIAGETLRDKLDREKQLGIDEALDIVRGVAAALGYAHSLGIIHRDIKPENILLHAGQALVADFGIALALSHAGGTRLTETGLSVGTPQYMSPEQAAGDRDIDARSDLYALGCVAYEMLVGDPPYIASTSQAIIAKVLSEQPAPIRHTRETVPAQVDAAVLRSLAKTPADRYSTAAQFADALTREGGAAYTARGAAAAAPRWRRRLPWLALTVAAGALAVWGWLRPRPSLPVVRAHIALPEGRQLAVSDGGAYALDLSRDGTRIVYAGEEDGARQLFLRPLDEGVSRALPETQGARQPFFSADGEWVGFFAGGELRRVSVTDGAPIAIATLPPGEPRGASWGSDGSILFVVGADLYRVRDREGEVERLALQPVLTASARRGDDSTAGHLDAESKGWPHHLPDGTHALLSIREGTGVLDLRSLEMRYVFAGTQARYLPTGHLIFNAGRERIRIVPFDVRRHAVTGPEIPALENVFRGPGGGAAHFAVSHTGTLVYVTGGFERSLWIVDREGRETPVSTPPRGFRFPNMSPDGRYVAVTVDPRPSNIWLVDVVRGSATPVTDSLHNLGATWSPDGERLVFTRDGDLHWLRWRANAAPERVARRPLPQYAPSWSPRGTIVAFETAPQTGADLVAVNVADRTWASVLATPADERLPSFSPDGRFVAFTTNVTGVDEVYVVPFPDPGTRHQVSLGGGTDPRWSPSGTELFYRNGNRIMAVEIRSTPDFAAAPPRELFSGPYDFTQAGNWDVTADGRFVMIKGDPATFRQLQIVVNWFAELNAEGGS